MDDLTQPIKIHGGKHYLAKKLIALFPPHLHYVEPFFGGGSVLLAKPCDGVSEVVNDRHNDLANFWNVLSDEHAFAMFRRIVEATPFSEERFAYAATVDTWDGWIERAVAFFIRSRQSRQGLNKDFATMSRKRVRRGMNEQVSSWLTAIEGLPEIHARMKRVVIFNRPAVDVIRQQDGPQTFYYLDPPYLHQTRSSTGEYAHEMTGMEHSLLLDLLSTIKGKFLLSGYPSDLYDGVALLNGWNHVDFDLPNNSSSAAKKERKIERVWANYPLPGGSL